jgi:hypothetical protein
MPIWPVFNPKPWNINDRKAYSKRRSALRILQRLLHQSAKPATTRITLMSNSRVCRSFIWRSFIGARKNGSSGRTRTYNPPVNSRMLCH